MTNLGQVIGDYEIIKEVGRGELSIVYQARHMGTKQIVAFKLFDPQSLKKSELVKRFQEEARLLASLPHERLVQVFDLGEEDGNQYVVMEYMAGGAVRPKDTWPLRAIATLMEDVAVALDYLHGQQKVHGNIKPSNILLDGERRAKLTDVSIVTVNDVAVDRSLATTIAPNTVSPAMPAHDLAYISPEQAKGQKPEARSDQYSLAIVVYELLTKQVPFSGNTAPDYHAHHIGTQPPQPSQLNPDLPKTLEEVVLKALGKNPAERYASCNDFAKAFRAEVLKAESTGTTLRLAAVLKSLEEHNTEQALRDLNNVALNPDDVRVKELKDKAVLQQRLKSGYDKAVTHWQNALDKAHNLREIQPPIYDPKNILDELVPLPVPPWRKFWQQWRTTLVIVFVMWSGSGVFAYGLLSFAQTPIGIALLNSPTPSATLSPTPSATPSATAPATATPTVTLTPTETQVPTPTATAPPSPTPVRDLLLLYHEDGFYMVNISQDTIEVEAITFERLGQRDEVLNQFEGLRWAEIYASLPPGRCMAIQIVDGNPIQPAECNSNGPPLVLRSFRRSETPVFWTTVAQGQEFRVVWQGEEIARCSIGSGLCSVDLP